MRWRRQRCRGGRSGDAELLAALERLGTLSRGADPTELRTFLAVCLENWPREPSLRRVAAGCCAREGDMTAALGHEGVALALDPRDWSIHRHMAQIMMRLGDDAGARAVLERGWLLRTRGACLFSLPVGRCRQLERERDEYFSGVSAPENR